MAIKNKKKVDNSRGVVVLSKNLWIDLKVYCVRNGIAMKALLEKVIGEYLEKHK